METMDDERLIYDYYRYVRSNKIIYFGRFWHCFRIERITKSYFFKFGWKNSSRKNQNPPDFYNNRHKMMMDFMRIDDCVDEINGKKINNSFAKTSIAIKKQLGKNYKKEINGLLSYVPDTSNSEEFNFKGYIHTFKRVLLDHSNKIPNYKLNHPKCKTTILFVCDESNNYVQISNVSDLKREDEKDVVLEKFAPHNQFHDSEFIDIIKSTKADYIIWFGFTKCLFINRKIYKYPQVAIYDVKHIKYNGLNYNHNLMFKVKEEYYPKKQHF